MGEPLRRDAFRGAADHGTLPAPRLRPPASRGDLHRSGRVRKALEFYGGHDARRRYGNDRAGVRIQQRQLDGQLLGRRKTRSISPAGGAGTIRRRLRRDIRGENAGVRNIALRGPVDREDRRRAHRGGPWRRWSGRGRGAAAGALSQTKFEGLGLGYEFIVDDKGVVTDLIATHISGPYKF